MHLLFYVHFEAQQIIKWQENLVSSFINTKVEFKVMLKLEMQLNGGNQF